MAASCEAGISGHDNAGAGAVGPRQIRDSRPCGRSISQLRSSVRQKASGAKSQAVAMTCGRMRRRQQADALRHQAGGESDGESIAVGADVQHVIAVGQASAPLAARRTRNCCAVTAEPPSDKRPSRWVSDARAARSCPSFRAQATPRNRRAARQSIRCAAPAAATRRRTAYSAGEHEAESAAATQKFANSDQTRSGANSNRSKVVAGDQHEENGPRSVTWRV